jgi:hypothetical protein
LLAPIGAGSACVQCTSITPTGRPGSICGLARLGQRALGPPRPARPARPAPPLPSRRGRGPVQAPSAAGPRPRPRSHSLQRSTARMRLRFTRLPARCRRRAGSASCACACGVCVCVWVGGSRWGGSRQRLGQLAAGATGPPSREGWAPHTTAPRARPPRGHLCVQPSAGQCDDGAHQRLLGQNLRAAAAAAAAGVGTRRVAARVVAGRAAGQRAPPRGVRAQPAAELFSLAASHWPATPPQNNIRPPG